jgi:hypothetical protein
MFLIGLIDDEDSEIKKIRRTIKTNAPANVDFDFKSYNIPDNGKNAVEIISNEIIKDIEEQRVMSLIIDYKIMVQALKVQGTDILKNINDFVPKFPIIILTERVEDSIQPEFVDADKVYKKKDFFKLEEEYSKEKVTHIFDSMSKYVNQKDQLLVNLNQMKKKLSTGDRTVIGDVLNIEEELDKYIPIEETQMDRVYNPEKMKTIVELIEKADKLMGK